MGYCIYKITNSINSKVYIGQTNNFNKRWKSHQSRAKNKPRQAIETAMKKYGIDNFQCVLIDTCETQEEVNSLEKEYVAEYNSIAPNGYNIEAGGTYAPQSKASLEKISEALKGRPSRNKGVPCSEEQKIKTSKTMTGKKYSPERIKKSSDALKGKTPWNKGKSKLSEEQIINIRNDNRIYKLIAEEYHISKWMVCIIKKDSKDNETA